METAPPAVISGTSPLSRYEDLLSWVEAVLSAQGLDHQAVRQALLRLSEPVQVEDVRREQRASGAEIELQDSRSSR